MQQRQLRAKWLLSSTRFFVLVSSLKLSRRLLYSVRFVFVSTFNLQRGRAFVVGITSLSKQAVCVEAKAPADHVYQRRTWDELKRVLSVAHATKPVERAENLEYRNQLSGVCWGAVYCSSHKDLRSESMFLNHALYMEKLSIKLLSISTGHVNIIFHELQIALLPRWRASSKHSHLYRIMSYYLANGTTIVQLRAGRQKSSSPSRGRRCFLLKSFSY